MDSPRVIPGRLISVLAAMMCAAFVVRPLTAGTWPDPASLGSRTDESQATSLLYVNPAAPWASDSNPGTQVRPLRTLTRATELAADYNARGVGVRVEIAPATYRESVRLVATGHETPAPVVFEATTKGAAVVSGADVWTDWRPDGPDGVYSHDWPYAWGLVPYPAGWDCCVVLSDLTRRKEMFFVNGQRLRQVLSKDELIEASFFVSESSHTVYARSPANTSIAMATVEAAVRSPLLLVQGRSNIVVRGLSFRYDNSGVGGAAAVSVYNSTDVRIEDCTMEWNNYRGMAFADVDHVTVRGNVANSNGSAGVGGWKMSSTVFADNETSYNNWRGNDGGFRDWDPAGMKLMLLRDTAILRQTLSGNFSYGLWLDTDCANVLIEAAKATENLNDGMLLEAVQGPIKITNSVMSKNARSGILSANAASVDFSSNTIIGNGQYQVFVSGAPGDRQVQDYQTGASYPLQSENWAVSSNVITAETPAQALIGTTLPAAKWQAFVRSLSSDWNTWFNPAERSAFRWVNGVPIDFPTWQSWTQQDRHSCC